MSISSRGGYCAEMEKATEFDTAFHAMKYLAEQDEDDITEFDFIEEGPIRKR